MTKLEYTFKNDTLFKMLFVKFPDLLKKLAAELLGIRVESIGNFVITNPEMPPVVIGDKFCRLDINMTIDGQRVDLEIQVSDEGNYPERSLYYWAREYSAALGEGEDYSVLPRTIIISILAFKLFDCAEFHSEFQTLEVKRHVPLSDKQVLHYFELPKLPKNINADDELKLWLALFKAETEEDLAKIKALEVSVMNEAIEAYRQVTAADEFKEIERLRSLARHNEASALNHARREARSEAFREADQKWQGVITEIITEKVTLLAKKDTLLEEKDTLISEQGTLLSEKDAIIAEQEALLAEFKARLGEKT